MNDTTTRDSAPGAAPAWRPRRGDVITGLVVKVDKRESKFKVEYPVVTVERDPDGQRVAVHGLATVLADELKTQQPVVGERITIECHGRVEGKDYDFYRVVVHRENDRGIWDQFAPAAQPPAGVYARVEHVIDLARARVEGGALTRRELKEQLEALGASPVTSFSAAIRALTAPALAQLEQAIRPTEDATW